MCNLIIRPPPPPLPLLKSQEQALQRCNQGSRVPARLIIRQEEKSFLLDCYYEYRLWTWAK